MRVCAAVGERDELGECIGAFGTSEEGGMSALVAFGGEYRCERCEMTERARERHCGALPGVPWV